MKKRVLFFLFGGVGGAERMTLNFGKLLPKDKFDVVFVVCGRICDILEFAPHGYIIDYIKWHNSYVFPHIRIAAKIIKYKPDFVFSSTMQLNVLLLPVSKQLKVPCIIRNDNMLSYISKGLRKQLAKYYKFAYKIVAQTEEMQSELILAFKLDSKKIICIHNPVDIQTINSKLKNANNPYPKDNYINYVWVANFNPAKAHDILIKAFEIVHKFNPKTRLYFVGKYSKEESNYEKVRNLVENSTCSEFIYFTGFQTNPYNWIKYSSCFVLPSRMEGLPNVLLEAMYLKIPVVASTCIPIIERIVENGYNGYTVKPEDIKGLAKAMIKAPRLKNFDFKYQEKTTDILMQLFK